MFVRIYTYVNTADGVHCQHRQYDLKTQKQ